MSKINQTKIVEIPIIKKRKREEELSEETEKEVKHLISINAFNLQREVFEESIQKAFPKLGDQINFLTNLLKLENEIRNEYERMENLFPRKRKSKYFSEGKDLAGKIKNAKKSNEINRKRIEEYLAELLENQDSEESDEE